jgi:hypothetical protein
VESSCEFGDEPFLTSAPVGGEQSASRLCHVTPGEEPPGTHWIGYIPICFSSAQ